MFVVRGFDRVTIRDIGEAAGLTNPALYRHFPDKESLGLALYRECYERQIEVVDAAVDPVKSPLAKIGAYVSASIAFYEQDPDAVLYVDEHQQRFWPRLAAERGSDTLTGRVSRWVAQARRLKQLSHDMPAAGQVALTMGFVAQWCAMRAAGLTSPQSATRLAGFVCGSLMRELGDGKQ